MSIGNGGGKNTHDFFMYRRLTWSLMIAGLLPAGCTSAINQKTPPPPGGPKVQHIVVIMQENRTFDNLFNGFPGADTVSTGNLLGQSIPLQPLPLGNPHDIDHTHLGWWAAWDNGKLDNFNHGQPLKTPNEPYSYVPESELVPYWTLARNYTLGDRMFQSNTGPSFVAHQYMIAGQSADTDENPDDPKIWGCDSPTGTTVNMLGPNGTDLPGVFPCFDYQTIADLLDAQGISWRYYAGSFPTTNKLGYLWSAFDAVKHIRYGPDWTNNVISPPPQVLTDIANGHLAQVTWITPMGEYSDHPSESGGKGPDWVASITNAIGASQFWNTTVIFISWDDWGGFYDHVPPPQIDDMGLGFRVPVIVVSPYAKHGYVSHVTHEFSGFLKFTEETFNLPSLGMRDMKADDFADCFDYTQAPQPYTRIPITINAAYFTSHTFSELPDDY